MILKPFISIIIPIYKVERFLPECLDSILNWNFKNWEAILIDDGSPDNCGKICDEYASKDSRFKVIHKQNQGVSIARNLGLDIAQGEWCWFVDSDDEININTPIDYDLFKDKDIIMFEIKTFNDGEKISYKNEEITYDICKDINIFYSKWISYTHTTHWYRRKFWGKEGLYAIRFTKGIKLGEDLEFMRKCELLSKNPLKINYTNYYYRIREGSAFHRKDIQYQVISDTFKVLHNLYEFIIQHNLIVTYGLLSRFTNLATCIPAYAIKYGLWSSQIKKDFQYIVKMYDSIGVHLTKSRYIWLATKMSWILKLINKIKS